jgi:hypothetical protein
LLKISEENVSKDHSMISTDKLKKKPKRKVREGPVVKNVLTLPDMEDGEVEEESALQFAAPKDTPEHDSAASEVDEAMATGTSPEQPPLKKVIPWSNRRTAFRGVCQSVI